MGLESTVLGIGVEVRHHGPAPAGPRHLRPSGYLRVRSFPVF